MDRYIQVVKIQEASNLQVVAFFGSPPGKTIYPLVRFPNHECPPGTLPVHSQYKPYELWLVANLSRQGNYPLIHPNHSNKLGSSEYEGN